MRLFQWDLTFKLGLHKELGIGFKTISQFSFLLFAATHLKQACSNIFASMRKML